MCVRDNEELLKEHIHVLCEPSTNILPILITMLYSLNEEIAASWGCHLYLFDRRPFRDAMREHALLLRCIDDIDQKVNHRPHLASA